MAYVEDPWLKLARADLGIRETPGVANNPLIMKRMAPLTKKLGTFYNADSVPWCAAMMTYWFSQCGLDTPAIGIRAKSWSTWGSNLDASKIAPGAVLYMERDGGGHVTLYVGENADFYFGLGANQGDAITIAKFPKSRIKAIRWPKGWPVRPHKVMMDARGIPVSKSEA